MKAVMVVYNNAIDPEVGEMMNASGIEHYTKFTSAFGKGPGSGPRLGDAVWPGGNNAVLVVTSPEAAQTLIRQVEVLQKDIPAEGLRAFWWEVEGMV